MSKSIAALALTTLGFGSASAYLLGELRSEREQSQSLQAQIDELKRPRPVERDPFDRPPPPAPEVEPAPAAVSPPPGRPKLDATASANTAVVTEAPVFANRPMMMMDRQRQLLQDPEYRKAMLAQQKYAMHRMYPDLRSALGLQPQEADLLMDLLAEQQLNLMSNQPPFRGRGQPPDAAEMERYQQQLQQQQRERDAQIASLLGDSKLQEWQSYQKTLGARMQIRELRTEWAEAGMPLREGQIEPLVNALAEEQNSRVQGSIKYRSQVDALGPTPANRVNMMEADLERTADYNRRLHDAAAPYLTHDQLRRLDQHLNQQLEMQRANVKLMRAQQEAVARGDIQMPNAESGAFRSVPGPFVRGAEAVVVPH